ncbi:hypothetical protein DFJ74DRAFT_650365 [Hyaloraphidium curvatum]|nr:hypothetical protein DFJ74DRAFT_650365 [Hyaloraphidium curvatum]
MRFDGPIHRQQPQPPQPTRNRFCSRNCTIQSLLWMGLPPTAPSAQLAARPRGSVFSAHPVPRLRIPTTMSPSTDRLAAHLAHLLPPSAAEDAALSPSPTAGAGGKPKLYDSKNAPNPRLVRLFIHEKGIGGELDVVNVDINKNENRQAPYTDKNPGAQVPALELPDGTVVAEVTVICELLQDLFPHIGPNLIGETPVERALTRMWCRRIDYKVAENIFVGFRAVEGNKFFTPRMKLFPEASPSLKEMARIGTMWFDEQLRKSGKPYLQGDKMMLSDLWLYTVLHFGRTVKQPVNPEAKAIAEWMKRMDERASIKAIKA